MLRVSRWLDRGRSTADHGSVDIASESQNLQKALAAVELIMDDNISGAEERLAQGDSAFHKLAAGTLGFLKATLGFEQENMREATALLVDAENSAQSFYQKAINDSSASASAIYGRGSEFALCQAEAQIMNAVVGILNESLTESIKGFYKMRKAYFILDNLAQMETAYVKAYDLQKLKISNESQDSFASAKSEQRPELITSTPAHPSGLRNAESVGDDHTLGDGQQVDLQQQNDTVRQQGKLNQAPLEHNSIESSHLLPPYRMEMGFDKDPTPLPSGATTPVLQRGVVTPESEGPLINSLGLLNADANSPLFSKPVDIFIHSGVNLMSGIINLLLSVIPPTFGRLLSIIGFRGNREKGLQMLWQATKFSNVNGAMAGLILCTWYNGVIGFCDIISESNPDDPDDVNGFPTARLRNLLTVMRARYPNSLIWRLEEARTYSSQRQISKALEILNRPHETQLKQLKALHKFETGLDYLNSHQYELCAKSFLECADLNGWSPAVYYYCAGAAYLQLYRDSISGGEQDAATTQKYAEQAEKYFREAPQHIAKKKLMGRQLPLDTFVARKFAKWTERSKSLDCSFVDAVGVAPLEEMAIVWNGFKKRDEHQLQKSLKNITWLADHSSHWRKEDDENGAENENERAIMTILKAIVLRQFRQHEEAKALLNEKVLSYDASTFRGGHHDQWVGPSANYEMAANLWMERAEYISRHGSTLTTGAVDDSKAGHEVDWKQDAALVAEAKVYVEKAKNWGSYELDTRIGMKVTAGHGAILRWEARYKESLR